MLGEVENEEEEEEAKIIKYQIISKHPTKRWSSQIDLMMVNGDDQKNDEMQCVKEIKQKSHRIQYKFKSIHLIGWTNIFPVEPASQPAISI